MAMAISESLPSDFLLRPSSRGRIGSERSLQQAFILTCEAQLESLHIAALPALGLPLVTHTPDPASAALEGRQSPAGPLSLTS